MDNDGPSNVRDNHNDVDSGKAEKGKAESPSIGTLVRQAVTEAFANRALERYEEQKVAVFEPPPVEVRLMRLEQDRDALIEGIYWGLGTLLFLVALGAFRGRH